MRHSCADCRLDMKNILRPFLKKWKFTVYLLVLLVYAMVLLITVEPVDTIDYSDLVSEVIVLIQPIIWFFFADLLIRSQGPNTLVMIGLLVFSLGAVSDLMDEVVEIEGQLGMVEDIGLPLGLMLISPALIVVSSKKRDYMKFLEQREAAARETSLTDSLTNLGNRRFFEEYFTSLLRSPYLYKGHITIVFIDLDNFKSLNDTFGHQEGDAALQKLAEIISESIREKDIACRYGGDEFLILLEGATSAAAAAIVERIRTNFAEFCRGKSRKLKRKVSLSAGITQAGRFESFSDVVNRADRAMYRAKSDGKDGAAQL